MLVVYIGPLNRGILLLRTIAKVAWGLLCPDPRNFVIIELFDLFHSNGPIVELRVQQA